MKTELAITEVFFLSQGKAKQKLYVISYYLIAVVLLISGASKIANPENLITILNRTLSFLNEDIIILISTLLPVLELTLGLMLMFKQWVSMSLFMSVILFVSFLLYSIYGTLKGFDVDCGCFGESIRSEFGAGMIVRNLIFTCIVIFDYKHI